MATRHEEIREGMIKHYCECCYQGISDRCEYRLKERPCEHAYRQTDWNLNYLDSQGVVLKVERDLVNTTSETEAIKSKLHKAVDDHVNNETTFIELMQGIVEASYEAVEPLIEEGKND